MSKAVDPAGVTEPTFVSLRGRVYSSDEVRKIVLARLAAKQRKGGLKYPAGWQLRVLTAMSDEWLRRHNGEIPGALAIAVAPGPLHDPRAY